MVKTKSEPKSVPDAKAPAKGAPTRRHILEAAWEKKSIRRVPAAEVKAMLKEASSELNAILQDEAMRAETPIEVQAAIQTAVQAMDAACSVLGSVATAVARSARRPGRPTYQQGQFLAFIREYMMRNQSGVAPSHADLQRFFDLTPPSVNSMLIRLEGSGFIRRIPGRARAIEIIAPPDFIPPLDRPFKG